MTEPTPQAQPGERASFLAKLEPEDMLEELLAVIHGDGGHYSDQHGLAKATADAEALWNARAALASQATPGDQYDSFRVRQEWFSNAEVLLDNLLFAYGSWQRGSTTSAAEWIEKKTALLAHLSNHPGAKT
jgi:hypothetical protein